MKNIYILALRDGNCPSILKYKAGESLNALRYYKNSYFIGGKAETEKVWSEWFKIWEERKDDDRYPDFY